MSQVRKLADDVKAAHPDGIDMLANNAGIFADRLKVQNPAIRTLHCDAIYPCCWCAPTRDPNTKEEATESDRDPRLSASVSEVTAQHHTAENG